MLATAWTNDFVWKQDKKVCTRCSRGTHDPDLVEGIVRMLLLSPMTGDLFYQCLVLKHKTGATLFKDLQTVGETEYETYNEACSAMGLVEDDLLWIECMREAKAMKMPRSMRHLFCNIIPLQSVSEEGFVRPL